MKIELQKNVYFAYCRDFEYVAVVAGLLADNLEGRLCREIYGEAFVSKMKKKHRELAEIINSMYLGGLEMLEFLMDYQTEKFDFKEYLSYIESMDTAQFIYQFFGYSATLEEVKTALKDDEALAKLMDENKLHIKSYVNLKHLINHRKEYLDLYVSCIEDIKVPELEEYLDQYEKLLPQLEAEIRALLSEKTPIEVSQEIMNKCFRTIRDYKYYAFLPVAMLPRNAVTYFEKNQYVLYSKNRMISRQKPLNILKVVSDETIIRIIDLISESGKVNGKRISEWIKIAPSTVSHHMEQLVECGLVKEEKHGNYKEYSIHHENGENLIKELEGIILKNTDYRL